MYLKSGWARKLKRNLCKDFFSFQNLDHDLFSFLAQGEKVCVPKIGFAPGNEKGVYVMISFLVEI